MPVKTKKLSDNVNKNLLTVKKCLNLSIRRIASATNKASSIVGYYFRGAKNPPEDWIECFCSVYCVNKDWLINRDGEPVFTGQPNIAVMVKSSQNAGSRVRALRKK